jgi:hypothetical protein
VKAIKSIFDTHADWVDLGRPPQILDPASIEKVEAKLDPGSVPARRPKKPAPIHTVHGAGEAKGGVPLSEIRDFFLQQPAGPDLKR